MYTSKYCTTVLSILYNVFPLLGAKTWCGSSTFDLNSSVWGGCVETGSENPSTSTRQVAQTLHTSQNALWQVVHDQQLYPYHLQKVHAFLEEDYPRRVQFAEWYLQQCILQLHFSSLVLFTDECTFTRNGILNLHNMHVWEDENPCAQVFQSHQHRFSINVRAGIIADHIIGPNILTREIYLTFLRNKLPTLFGCSPTRNSAGNVAATRRSSSTLW